jgi:hypothetical protein
MERSKFLPKPVPLSLAQQVFRMGRYPQLRAKMRRNIATWTGEWCPSIISEIYQIKITYEFLCRPRIAILQPSLERAEGQTKLPHVYNGQDDICVHRPEEWNSRLFIADTIMPWISQWLYFYEVWAQTGAWMGKGTHPNAPQHSEG